jgi:hypothetical protein
MSAIHQALQRATNTPSEPLNQNDYNPLASNLGLPKKKAKGIILYWILAGAFLVLIPVVVFWPTAIQPTPVESQQALLDGPDLEQPESNNTALLVESSPVESEALVAADTPSKNDEPKPLTPNNETIVSKSDTTNTPPASPAKTSLVSPPSSNETQPNTQPVVKPEPVVQKPIVAAVAKVPEEPKTESSLDVVTVSAKHWQSKVEQHLADGNIEHAEAVLKQWIGGAPQDEAPRLWLARIYLSNQSYSSAEALLSQLESNEALALKGILFEKTKRYSLASAQFSELFEREPESGRWLLMWAVNTENSGKLARSLDLYQAFIRNFNYEDEALTTFAQQRIRALGGT